jgi:hypothetical protein
MKKAGLSYHRRIDRSWPTSAFQENGRFSAAKYRAMSDSEGLALRESIKANYAMSRYVADTVDLRVPTKEKEFMKTIASPERSFEMVAFPPLSYPASESRLPTRRKERAVPHVRLLQITISSERSRRQEGARLS